MKNIRIVSPAKFIDKESVFFAKRFLENAGFKVELSKHCLGNYNYFSGTDEERRIDFQNALDDKNLDAILCSRGGFGCVRIIDDLDFSVFVETPKLILGFSDVTVFHNHINKYCKIPTIHSSAPLNFKTNSKESLQSIIDVLTNQPLYYQIKPHPNNVFGQTEAEIIGGNLSILYSLIGTNSDIDYTNKILFIEDLSESIYAVDRMLWSFKKAGKFNALKGVIIGGFTNISDTAVSYGKTLNELFLEQFSLLNIPVCFGFPAGHIDDNRSLRLGHLANLNVNSKGVVFKQSPITSIV
jgi:muramoyltetrapeptide carboxypeptidase